MRPEAIVEGEIMGLFVFLFVLVENCRVLFHLYAADAAEELLARVKGTNPDGYFDTHLGNFLAYI